MGILINQGKHVEEEQYKILDEKNVNARIIKLEVNPRREFSLIITMQLLTGDNKNRTVNDYVDYNPDSKNAWRYRSLRKSANVPYSSQESERIDIEKLLLNKLITIDLSPRTYEYNGETRTVQNVSYKETVIPTEPIKEESIETVVNVDKEDWPF